VPSAAVNFPAVQAVVSLVWCESHFERSGGFQMRRALQFLLVTTTAACGLAQGAAAQDPVVATYGGTTISVGGGFQLLQLPDMNFTFRTNSSGDSIGHQKNSDFDEYGGVFVAEVATPLGMWGNTPVTGVLSGFFANVDDSQTKRCSSSNNSVCTVEDIVDNPNRSDSLVYDSFTTRTHRDADYWGADLEARFGQAPLPRPDSGGYLFRFAYVGIGTGVRGIDQDNRLRLTGDGPDVNYNENLDTTYWGGFLSIGGEYNLLGYLGVGSGWGLRSLVSLRGGVYNAETDYNGRYSAESFSTTRLGLSDDEVAFIGGATLETRKQFGPRTSLSLVTDYEYFSYIPEMKYVDRDVSGTCGGTCDGTVNRTHISDDDGFEIRTTLRLNIGLGPSEIYPLK
jgi:hypothetical protein